MKMFVQIEIQICTPYSHMYLSMDVSIRVFIHPNMYKYFNSLHYYPCTVGQSCAALGNHMYPNETDRNHHCANRCCVVFGVCFVFLHLMQSTQGTKPVAHESNVMEPRCACCLAYNLPTNCLSDCPTIWMKMFLWGIEATIWLKKRCKIIKKNACNSCAVPCKVTA